ncbi:MAG: hypothetical protein ACYCSS_13930 [Sulfuriferula sp.]
MSESIDIFVPEQSQVAVEVKNGIMCFLSRQWAFFVSTLPLKGNASNPNEDAWW